MFASKFLNNGVPFLHILGYHFGASAVHLHTILVIPPLHPSPPIKSLLPWENHLFQTGITQRILCWRDPSRKAVKASVLLKAECVAFPFQHFFAPVVPRRIKRLMLSMKLDIHPSVFAAPHEHAFVTRCLQSYIQICKNKYTKAEIGLCR